MAIETSLAIGADIKDLREFESIFIIHAENPSHKDKHASIERTFLHILTLHFIFNTLEAERFDFVLDLIDALVDTSIVTHGAVLSVEI